VTPVFGLFFAPKEASMRHNELSAKEILALGEEVAGFYTATNVGYAARSIEKVAVTAQWGIRTNSSPK
jgi:hypothetical protein